MELEENSDNVPNDEPQSFVESELETLQSIYINEIEVKQDDDQNSTCVSIDLHPATADKPEEQYVKMTLKFTLYEEYPQTIPDISIRNPRGLSDEKLNSIHQDLMSIAETKIGNSMLFEIIEAAKEHLTAGNRPCGECAICLYGFSEEDVFTKTDCYHYFHTHCLARYARNASETEMEDKDSNNDDVTSNNELLCPMCRVPIQFTGLEEVYPPPAAGDDEYVINEQILEMQRMMADLYQKQLENGGIIDVEAEKNKFLLEISNVPTRLNTTEEEEESLSDAGNNTEENSVTVPQSGQKDKLQSNREVQNESRNAPTKFKDRTGNDRPERKFDRPSNNKYRSNNNYRFNKKHEKSSELNEKDFAVDYSFKLEEDDGGVDEGAGKSKGAPKDSDYSPGLKPSKQSPIRKDRQRYNNYSRPKRNNYDDYGRDNQYRNSFPSNRSRGRGYGQNVHQRSNYNDRPYQDSRRFDSNRTSSFQHNSNTVADSAADSNAISKDARDSLDTKNASDSYRKDYSFDRGHSRGRGRFQNRRYPESSYRDRDSNYPRKTYPKQHLVRNSYRQEEDYGSYRDRNSKSRGNFHKKYEQDSCQASGAGTQASVIDGAESEFQSETHTGENKTEGLPPRQQRNFNNSSGSFHERNSLKKDRMDENRETESIDDGTLSHDAQCSESQNACSFNEESTHSGAQAEHREGNFNRNANRYVRENSEGKDERRYSNSRSDYDRYDRQSVRDRKQFSNRRNYGEENGGQFQRNDHYSQDRRNIQRNSYGGNQYNYREKSRGRSNSHFQNRNSNYEGNQRKYRYSNENSGFRNDRDSYKFKDSSKLNDPEDTNEASENGRLSDDLQQVNTKVNLDTCIPEVNGTKTLNTTVKPFVPKEDLGVLNSDVASFKDLNIGDAELSSTKLPSPPPPPGFSNPSKKIVYGLQAANPPPGFPRR